MKRNRNIYLALFVWFLFISSSLIYSFFDSYLEKNNRSITKMPSLSNINLLWKETCGGSTYDYGNGIAIDDLGNVFITGSTDSYGAGSYDVLLLKYDSDGNFLWEKTWGGSAYDYGNGIAIDDLGNVFIAGYSWSYETSGYDMLLLKYDSDGNLLWNNTWGGSNDDYGNGIAIDDLGNAFMMGNTDSFGVSGYDVILLKYDSAGYLLWEKTWESSAWDRGSGIAIDDLGNAFITGVTNSFGLGDDKVLLLKYDSDGNLLWNNTWGGPNYAYGHDYGKGIAIDGSGNIFIAGYTWNYEIGVFDVLLLKYDSDGKLLWNNTWGGSNYDYGNGITIDDLGNAFITGYTDSFGAGSYDVLLLKYDSAGYLLCEKTWGGSAYDYGNGIAIDDLGNEFITGVTESYGAGGYDVLLLKYGLDTDDDGLGDHDEINTYFTNPNNSDTDGDGISDGDEVYIHETDPNNSDTDGDGISDGDEVELGLDPNNPLSNLFTTLLIVLLIVIIIAITLLIERKKIIIVAKKINKKRKRKRTRNIEAYLQNFMVYKIYNTFIERQENIVQNLKLLLRKYRTEVITFSLYFVYLLIMRMIIPVMKTYGGSYLDWDMYLQMSQDISSIFKGEIVAPFCYRPLIPFIAGIMPFDLETNYIIIIFVSAYLLGILVYFTLRLKFNKKLSILGLILLIFLSYIPTAVEVADGPWYFSFINAAFFVIYFVDLPAACILMGCFYCIFSSKKRLYSILLIIGALTKEIILFTIPVFILYKIMKSLEPNRRRKQIKSILKNSIYIIPSILVHFVLRLIVIPIPTIETFWYENYGGNDYGTWRMFMYFFDIRLYELLNNGALVYWIFGVWSPIIIYLCCINNYRSILRWISVHGIFVFFCYFQMFLGFSTARYMQACFYPIIYLAISGLHDSFYVSPQKLYINTI